MKFAAFLSSSVIGVGLFELNSNPLQEILEQSGAWNKQLNNPGPIQTYIQNPLLRGYQQELDKQAILGVYLQMNTVQGLKDVAQKVGKVPEMTFFKLSDDFVKNIKSSQAKNLSESVVFKSIADAFAQSSDILNLLDVQVPQSILNLGGDINALLASTNIIQVEGDKTNFKMQFVQNQGQIEDTDNAFIFYGNKLASVPDKLFGSRTQHQLEVVEKIMPHMMQQQFLVSLKNTLPIMANLVLSDGTLISRDIRQVVLQSLTNQLSSTDESSMYQFYNTIMQNTAAFAQNPSDLTKFVTKNNIKCSQVPQSNSQIFDLLLNAYPSRPISTVNGFQFQVPTQTSYNNIFNLYAGLHQINQLAAPSLIDVSKKVDLFNIFTNSLSPATQTKQTTAQDHISHVLNGMQFNPNKIQQAQNNVLIQQTANNLMMNNALAFNQNNFQNIQRMQTLANPSKNALNKGLSPFAINAQVMLAPELVEKPFTDQQGNQYIVTYKNPNHLDFPIIPRQLLEKQQILAKPVIDEKDKSK